MAKFSVSSPSRGGAMASKGRLRRQMTIRRVLLGSLSLSCILIACFVCLFWLTPITVAAPAGSREDGRREARAEVARHASQSSASIDSRASAVSERRRRSKAARRSVVSGSM